MNRYGYAQIKQICIYILTKTGIWLTGYSLPAPDYKSLSLGVTQQELADTLYNSELIPQIKKSTKLTANQLTCKDKGEEQKKMSSFS